MQLDKENKKILAQIIAQQNKNRNNYKYACNELFLLHEKLKIIAIPPAMKDDEEKYIEYTIFHLTLSYNSFATGILECHEFDTLNFRFSKSEIDKELQKIIKCVLVNCLSRTK